MTPLEYVFDAINAILFIYVGVSITSSKYDCVESSSIHVNTADHFFNSASMCSDTTSSAMKAVESFKSSNGL